MVGESLDIRQDRCQSLVCALLTSEFTHLHFTPASTLALDPNFITKLNRSFLQLLGRHDLINDSLLEQLRRRESMAEQRLSKDVGGSGGRETQVEETSKERRHGSAEVDLHEEEWLGFGCFTRRRDALTSFMQHQALPSVINLKSQSNAIM